MGDGILMMVFGIFLVWCVVFCFWFESMGSYWEVGEEDAVFCPARLDVLMMVVVLFEWGEGWCVTVKGL